MNEDTSVVLDTLTNQEGLYRVGALVPGKYRVEVELGGFEPVIRRPIVLEVGQTLAVDVMLDIAPAIGVGRCRGERASGRNAELEHRADRHPPDAGRAAAAEPRGVVARRRSPPASS